MARIWKLRSAQGFALAALVGAALFLTSALAQEKGAPAPKATWITAGFVRPGTATDGKVAEGNLDGALGGTIYYAVYQLSNNKRDANDPYNTGMPDLLKQFVAGGGSGSTKSPPNLVTDKNMPKYLYLYQVVNDRGLDQPSKDGIRLAANADVKTSDIGSLVLGLPVDPTAIQSWGSFKNAGFAINAIDRGGAGQERPTSEPAKTHMSVSANPSVLVKIRDMNGHNYTRMASPIEFKANSGFTVDTAGKNLKNSLFIQELAGRKTKLVAWEQESLNSAEVGGDMPDSVDIMKFTDGDKTKASSVLRASFASNPLKVGRNSVLIGFTTNIGPGKDLVRLQDAAAAKKNTGIRTVSTEDIDFGAGGQIAIPKEQPQDVAGADMGQKPSNLVVQGIVSPGDIPPGAKLVDQGAYKSFGGTVYFAVYKKMTANGGDTWSVGRNDFDSLFVAGESHRSTFSPRLDTDAEYLYLYQVVNDRGFHDLKLPQNKAAIETVQVANDVAEERTPITREVASFSLFLRIDPRLITSWGYFNDSGFIVKVPNETEIRQVANDPSIKPMGMNMAVSSNISILDTLYPNKDKVYRSWAPPVQVDFGRTSFGIGKDTLNINANNIKPVANDRAGGIRFVANKTLDKVITEGAIRPDYAQIIYFDGQNPANGATIDGVTLGSAEVARALFKVEWLTKTITEGQHSVVFGFTSNVEPVRAPVRIKDLSATIKNSSEAQERVFLSPSQIQALARNALKANAAGIGAAPGTGAAAGATGQAVAAGTGSAAGIVLAGLNTDAPDAALAVADGLGEGILPVGLSTLARGSIGAGIGISPSIPTPNAGSVGEQAASGSAGVVGLPPVASSTGSGTSGGGTGGGFGGGVGAIGSARMPMFGGGGSGGGSGGSSGGNSGSSNSGSSGSSNSGSAGSTGNATATNTNNINFNMSQTNQQSQSQFQYQHQHQHQNQHQSGGRGGHDCCNNGNVVPAPASLLLGLLGLPGLYVAYRRRRGQAATEQPPSELPPEELQI